MSYVVVDCESDGPIPGKYSLVSFGAVIVEKSLTKTFYAETKPISDIWIPEALAISGFTREQHLAFPEPKEAMIRFKKWLQENSKGHPVFISDNNGYDWIFICWYFHTYLGENPFGYSSQNIGSIYKGMVKDTSKNFKHLRKTKHSHHPVDDCIGNAEALLEMQKMGLKIRLE